MFFQFKKKILVLKIFISYLSWVRNIFLIKENVPIQSNIWNLLRTNVYRFSKFKKIVLLQDIFSCIRKLFLAVRRLIIISLNITYLLPCYLVFGHWIHISGDFSIRTTANIIPVNQSWFNTFLNTCIGNFLQCRYYRLMNKKTNTITINYFFHSL